MPVILHKYETCTVTFRVEHKLWVFEKWVLRKIFGTKSDKIIGDWKKLHYEELHEPTFLNQDEMGEVHGTLQKYIKI